MPMPTELEFSSKTIMPPAYLYPPFELSLTAMTLPKLVSPAYKPGIKLLTPFTVRMMSPAEFETESENNMFPFTSSVALGELLPIPTLPFASITNAVEVAVSVEVEILKRSAVAFA